jgi:hypothetical protein
MLMLLTQKIKSKTGKNIFKYGLLALFPLFPAASFAQADSMLDVLDSQQPLKTEYVIGAFKSTRVINAQSVETLSEGVLDFRIMHRFGPVNQGFFNLWGLDQANTRFQFDYGVKDWLMVGIGRSAAPKSYGGYVKLKFLRQSKGKVTMPISVVYHGYMGTDATQYTDRVRNSDFGSRLSFVHQLLIGRKFNENFSLQLMPTFIHDNLVATPADKNDKVALGIGFRQKISKRVSINFEYFYLYPTLSVEEAFKNSLSLGVDIETGGHVFQIHLTNTLAMTENNFITDRNESWLNGGIHLGFNVSRVFTIYRPALKD